MATLIINPSKDDHMNGNNSSNDAIIFGSNNINNQTFNINNKIDIILPNDDKRLSPLKKAAIALKDPNWHYEDDYSGCCFYNEYFPDVRFVKKQDSESEEFHSFYFPSKPLLRGRSYKASFELIYNGQRWPSSSILAVLLDDGRGLIVHPCQWSSDNLETNEIWCSYYYVRESIEYLFHQVIQVTYPQYYRDFNFPVFESKEAAKRRIVEDQKKINRSYGYYFVTPGNVRYIEPNMQR